MATMAYNKSKPIRKEVCAMDLKYTIILEKDEDGNYIATVPALKGCHSFGKTHDDAIKHIKEAIELYLECLVEDKKPFPKDVETDSLNIRVETA